MEILRNLVYLRVGSHAALISRLFDIDGTDLVLGMATDDEGEVVLPDSGTPLEVGWVTKDGVQWHTAVSTGRTSWRRPSFGARLVDRPIQEERREHPRARATLDVELLPMVGEAVPGQIVDVSTGGLCVDAPVELAPDDLVQMAIAVPGEEPIRFTARVIHAAEGSYGLSFELLTLGARERLVRLAFERAAAEAA